MYLLTDRLYSDGYVWLSEDLLSTVDVSLFVDISLFEDELLSVDVSLLTSMW